MSAKLNKISLIPCLFLVGCAGWSRSCSSNMAERFGGDWLIVQYNNQGPMNCWKLKNESVVNETGSDGIYWKENGHLVHISGWYNRVQVSGGDYDKAAKLIGIDLNKCINGIYTEQKVVQLEKEIEKTKAPPEETPLSKHFK